MTLFWKDPSDNTYAILTKTNNEIITLKVGDFITYDGRPDGVRIEGFTYKSTDPRGPIGLTYLPWRLLEQRWASISWSFKGNTRHLIAFPVGAPHYGEQVEWDSVTLMNDGVCPDKESTSIIHCVQLLSTLQVQQ